MGLLFGFHSNAFYSQTLFRSAERGLVPSPFFKGKVRMGLFLCALKGICHFSIALYFQPLFRSAERVTFAKRRKSNQKVSLKIFNA